jgi:fatty acid desaturase
LTKFKFYVTIDIQKKEVSKEMNASTKMSAALLFAGMATQAFANALLLGNATMTADQQVWIGGLWEVWPTIIMVVS